MLLAERVCLDGHLQISFWDDISGVYHHSYLVLGRYDLSGFGVEVVTIANNQPVISEFYMKRPEQLHPRIMRIWPACNLTYSFRGAGESSQPRNAREWLCNMTE